MLNVAYKPFMLSVIMLSVFMLNVNMLSVVVTFFDIKRVMRTLLVNMSEVNSSKVLRMILRLS
jgi:hypothetical protein